jgi:predicted SnoaL-like aldol condensation-catalyzing enzyme
MPSAENKRISPKVLEELFEKGNLGAADELIHPNFVNHEAPPDNPQGPEALKETVSWLRSLRGPMRFEIEDGKVIEHWSVRDDLGQALQRGLIAPRNP